MGVAQPAIVVHVGLAAIPNVCCHPSEEGSLSPLAVSRYDPYPGTPNSFLEIFTSRKWYDARTTGSRSTLCAAINHRIMV